MTKYRLLALDLDGTLLNENSEITPGNQEWVQRAREAGITVILSTGRGFESALTFAEQLELNTPMITVNGGEIWREPHRIHRRSLLEPDMVARLHRLALRYPDVWYWGYTTDGLFNKERWLEDVYGKDWLKFGYYTEELDVLRAIREEIGSWGGLELSNSSLSNIEINPAGISKASAIEEVCRMIGCDMASAVSIGDSLNDIAAIRSCGLGIAMGNAQEEVKAAADCVTTSHWEDGVAQAIQEYVLKA